MVVNGPATKLNGPEVSVRVPLAGVELGVTRLPVTDVPLRAKFSLVQWCGDADQGEAGTGYHKCKPDRQACV